MSVVLQFWEAIILLPLNAMPRHTVVFKPEQEIKTAPNRIYQQMPKTDYTRNMTVIVTAYTIGDDHTPGNITASGKKPYVGSCAFNDVPLGTEIEVDGKRYVVEDRARDDGVVDIYRESVYECYQVGRKRKQITVFLSKEL